MKCLVLGFLVVVYVLCVTLQRGEARVPMVPDPCFYTMEGCDA